MQNTKSKKIIVTVLILIGIVLIVLTVKNCGSESKYIYEFSKIDKGPVKRTVSVTGVIEVINPARVLCLNGGITDEVYVDFNQVVKKGQLLAKIDVPKIDQLIYRKSMELESIRLELLAAKKEYQAKKNMYKENLFSKQAMEQAEIKYKTVLHKHKNVYLDYKNLKKQKDSSRVRAPISGIVLSKNTEPKLSVATGALLFIIAPTLKKMKLIINIDESEIGIIKKGQSVQFSVSAFPDKEFFGKINQIRLNPSKESSIVTYQSLVICDNENLILKPGMTATATVIVGKKEDAVRALNQAFIVSPEEIEYKQGQKFVWRKKGGAFEDVPFERISVKTGLSGDIYTEIITGVKLNDKVLIKITNTEE